MAQKHYGIIPHDPSLVGYGQETPVVDREAQMKAAMVRKIEASRRKKKKKKKIGEVGSEARDAIEKRQQALDEASDNK